MTPVDVMGHRQDEEEPERLHEQLRQAHKPGAVSTPAWDVAHGLHNTLVIILGYAGLALSKLGEDNHLRSSLREILVAGQRAKDLVRQILTFGRKSTPQRQPLRLRLTVEAALKHVRAAVQEALQHQDP
jgi:signal transduction histidine kinase